MYNTKLTRKDVTNMYGGYVFRCGYCDLHYIMNGVERTGYNSGIYGWNWDCFTVNGVAITTGYRNMVGKAIPFEIIEKYTKIARDYMKDHWRVDHKQDFEQLRLDFTNELKNLI